MSSLKVVASLALLAVVSAGHLPHYPSSNHGYGGFGSGSGFGGGAGFGSGAGFGGGGGFGYGGANIPILRYENVNNGDGTYRYNYETGNGISAHESGAPRAPGPEGLAVTAEGGFSYRAPDGQQVSLTYTADENGFHPTGSHLPTPPPIPDAILRSIQFNRQNPSSGDGYHNGGRYNSGYHY